MPTPPSGPIQWLQQLRSTTKNLSLDSFFVLVDQANLSTSLIPAVKSFNASLSWCSLFDDTPEEHLESQAPLLLQLNLSSAEQGMWLENLIEYCEPERILALISPLPLSALAKHLRGLSQASWGEQEGLLRFYDTRIFAQLFQRVLTPQQQRYFTDLVLFWSWRNRDEVPRFMSGTYLEGRLTPGISKKICINDAQVELFGCIGDAEIISRQLPIGNQTKEKHFERCLEAVLKISAKGYLGDIVEYVLNNKELVK